MSTVPRIGIVGIGAMGLAIAQRLRGRGFAVMARDVDRARERLAARIGATIATSPVQVAEACPIILSVVVDARQTEQVVFGRGGLSRSMRPGAVLLVCSTLAPAYVTSLAKRLQDRGVHVLDTPMSGGPSRARAGTMSMMVAGPQVARTAARRVLSAMSNQRFEWGERAGAAAAAKITNNLLAGANLAAAAEGLALGVKLGLDPRRLLDLFKASSGQSWIAEDRLRRAIANDFVPRAATTLLYKDLGIAIDAARAANAGAAMARVARRAFRAAVAAGWAEDDDAALYPVALGIRRARGLRGRLRPAASGPPTKPPSKTSPPTRRSRS